VQYHLHRVPSDELASESSSRPKGGLRAGIPGRKEALRRGASALVYQSDATVRAFCKLFGGEEEGGGVRSGPGEARTILLLHIISAGPS